MTTGRNVAALWLLLLSAIGVGAQPLNSVVPRPTVRPSATASITGNNNVVINSSDLRAAPLALASALASLGRPPVSEFSRGDELEPINALEVAEPDKRDIPKAFQLYVRAARKGNHQAQVQVGRLLLDVGSAAADVNAYKEFEGAIRGGNAEALAWQAWMHDAGRVPNRSVEMAVTLYERAANEGIGWAAFKLGVAHQKPTLGMSKDETKALRWYWRAAELYFAPAFSELSWILRFGEERNRDKKKAQRLLENGAKLNDCSSLFHLGYAYHNGDQVTQDYVVAVEYYKRAAVCGDHRAQNNLGNLLANGQGTAKDADAAIASYRKAIRQDNNIAAVNLGLMYESSNGVARDYQTAVKWYQHASDRGYANGKAALGVMYRFGYGVEKNAARALELFREAAEAGEINGTVWLGVMYDVGDGVPTDKAVAAKWYRRGVEMGGEEAMNNLAAMIDSKFVASLPAESPVKLWARAADIGSANAQFNLGMRYLRGQSVEIDTKKGIELLRKSSAQAHSNAQTILADALFSGKFQLPRDAKEAAKHAIGAAKTNNEAAALLYAIALENPKDVPMKDAEFAFSRLADLVIAPEDSNHAFAVLSLTWAAIDGKPLPISDLLLQSALYKLAMAGNSEAALQLFRLYGTKKPSLFFTSQGLDFLDAIIKNAGIYRPFLQVQRDFYKAPARFADAAELTDRMDAAVLSADVASKIAWARSMVDRRPDDATIILRSFSSQGNSDAGVTLCDLISKYKITPTAISDFTKCLR